MYIYTYIIDTYTYIHMKMWGLRVIENESNQPELVAGLISLLHFGGRVWDDEEFHLARILQVLFTTDHL